MSLKVDWCSHKAAKFACENWHYSNSIPVGKNCFIGVWEAGSFRGAVVFGWGANKNLSQQYGLEMTECYELVRIAMRDHKNYVSKVMAISRKMIRGKFETCRLLISYADPEQGHEGAIYQADNWLYLGKTKPSFVYKVGNKILHKRAYTGRVFGGRRMRLPPNAVKVPVEGKHKYAYPMDRAMRRRLEKISSSYP